MIAEIDITNRTIAEAVLSLQKEAYLIEADLLGTRDIPPLRETIEELMSCRERFFGYYEEGQLIGAIAFKYLKSVVDIHRVMVHPHFFRRGIARMLIRHVERQLPNAKLMIVSTGAKNTPAIKLYESLGFEWLDETIVSEGLRVANFKKKIKRDS